MRLQLIIDQGKDKSGQEKKYMWATLVTDIEGLGQIDTANSLDDCVLSRELEQLTLEMIALKTASIKENVKLLKSKRK